MVLVDKKQLLESLGRVRGFVSENNKIGILQNCCFRDGSLYGFDGECGVGTKSPVDLECCVSAQRLYKIVEGLGDQIDITLDGYVLRIEGGGYHSSTLPTASPAQYPQIIPSDLAPWSTATNLSQCIERVLPSATSDEDMEQCMGVAVRGKYVYTTDGHRMSRAALDTEVPTDATLLAKAAKYLVKNGQPTRTYLSNGAFVAVYEETGSVFVSSLLARRFPCNAIDQQFFAKMDHRYDAVFPEDLAAAVSRVRKITLGRTGDSSAVILENRDNTLLVRLTVQDVGTSEERMVWNFPYAFTVKINAQWFVDALKRTRNANLASVVGGQGSAIRFFDDGYDHSVALMV